MKFQYKKIAVTVSVIVMGISMITLSMKLPNDSDQKEQKKQEQQDGDQKDAVSSGGVAAATGDDKSAGGDKDLVETVAKDKGLEKNAHQEINDLITSYLNARLEGDEKKLAELVDDMSYLDMKDIQRRTERIEEYTTIDCYTLAGPQNGDYLVYVYSEVKVSDIDTLATGLDGFYVKTDVHGKMTICMGEVSEEVQQKLNEASEREDVQRLIQEVNDKFVKEVDADEKLAEYYNELSVVDALDKTKEDAQKEKTNKKKETD